MLEVEIKIIGIDPGSVERKLREMKADMSFKGTIDSYRFDFPNNSLRKEDKTVRLRKENERVVLTYKEPVPKSSKRAKVMQENELVVGSFDAMKSALEGIGLRVVTHTVKHRTSYSIGGIHYEIEKPLSDLEYPVEKIPHYLEIEGSSVEAVYAAAKALGFSEKDCHPWTLRDVCRHYFGTEEGKKPAGQAGKADKNL